jgi:RNA ligase (TIGR02306 family)
MERKLASVQDIIAIEQHPNADKLEIAKVLGWSCIVLKDQFKAGQKIVFIEPDAVLPERPEFEFMRPRHFRIKTIKLRGQVSQGLVFPMTILPVTTILDADLGDDVTEVLGIKKYEPYVPAHLAGQVKGNFPEFLHKTDEQRIQAVPEVLARWKGCGFQLTEKVDGTSMTVYLKDCIFGVCSRNLDLKETEDNTYWKVARELKLEEKLQSLNGNYALQGEMLGQGIQKNKYELPNVRLKLFNIFNIDTGKYLDQDAFVAKAGLLGLDTVPLLDWVVLDHTVEQLVELSKGNSKLNPKIPREGIVFRPEHEMYDSDLGRLSFKQINPDFLIKFDSE